MKLFKINRILIFSLVIFLVSCQEDPLKYVDPLIGTTKFEGITKWNAYGETYPGAAAPFGMVQSTPETSNGGYYYEQDSISAFTFIQHLSGWPGGSSGNLNIMPVTGVNLKEVNDQDQLLIKYKLNHNNEIAGPGYYKVSFDDVKLKVELTANTHSSIARYTFSNPENTGILISDVDSIVKISDFEFNGVKYTRYPDKVYFSIVFDICVLACQNTN